MEKNIGPAASQNGEKFSFPIIVELLGLKMHYGYFISSVVENSLAALRQGQKAFTLKIASLVISRKSKILDVGTGTGDLAQELSNMGNQVVTISPDPNQEKWIKPLLLMLRVVMLTQCIRKLWLKQNVT